MLKEFAVDPELLSNWQEFRFFISQFGVPSGRLISRFPGNWKAMVRNAAQKAKDAEFLRIVEALDRLDDLMLIREFDYHKGYQWLRNAVEENSKRPFHAIICSRDDGSSPNLLTGSGIDPTNPPALWAVQTSVPVKRLPADMASCVRTLLAQSREVMFIDPYFGPGKRRHYLPLQQFLACIGSRGTRAMPTKIEYHASNSDRDVGRFQSDLELNIKPHLPPGVTFNVIRWRVEEMHNRYVLTNRGGVMFGTGLDQDDQLPTGFDTVSLLDSTTCSELMRDYSQASTKLTWLNEIYSVVG